MARKIKRKKPKDKKHHKPRMSMEIQERPANQPKMSDTLVAFARPLLDTLPPGADKKEWDTCLMMASIVWNGVIANMEERVVFEFERAIGIDPENRRILNMLFERKRKLFAKDIRLIMDVRTENTPGGVRVIAASASSK